jgi:tocopherol O-methyltransferase
VRGHYDELDRVYRAIWGEHVHHGYWRANRASDDQATVALVELVAERLGLEAGQAVCDIGCGYGATAEHLAERYRVHVTGITISEQQRRIADAREPAAGTFVCVNRDWLANGMPDASFERVIAIESSEHMVDKERFFAEAARVLRPGGRLVVCAWLARSDPTAFEIKHVLEPICREGRLPSLGSREDYQAFARAAGFVATDYQDISRQVSRTWSIVARRVAAKLVTDAGFRRFAFSPTTRNRSFLFALPRLILAYRIGAMRYGVFTWRKPAQESGDGPMAGC